MPECRKPIPCVGGPVGGQFFAFAWPPPAPDAKAYILTGRGFIEGTKYSYRLAGEELIYVDTVRSCECESGGSSDAFP